MERIDYNKLPIPEEGISDDRPMKQDIEKGFEEVEKYLRKGTITWFEIAKGELPPKPSGNENSSLLLYNCDLDTTARGAFYWSIGQWMHNSGNWQPTHWAFLNLPTTQP